MTEETTKTPAKRATTRAEAEPNIFQRINLISQEAGALAPESRGGVPFAFRGIDGTVAHLTPFLHKYGVFNTSKVLSHIVTEREVGNRVVKTTQVEVEFEFFAPDGTSVTMVTPGLADDFADRSSAQSMSVAYRIALLQLFHLPTHSKEPEETGEDVQRTLQSGNAQAPRNKAVAAATAAMAPKTGDALPRLQQECKALGRSLSLEPSELNKMGTDLSGGKGMEEWFNDAETMTKLRDALKAKATA